MLNKIKSFFKKRRKNKRITKVRELANIFLVLLKDRPEAIVDMSEVLFHPCGTTACHAGWFAVSQGKENNYNYGFMDAAKEMARFLGFSSRHELELWARDNPKLWGNNSGYWMFGDREAFGLEDREPTLREIGEHWYGVADRMEKL